MVVFNHCCGKKKKEKIACFGCGWEKILRQRKKKKNWRSLVSVLLLFLYDGFLKINQSINQSITSK